MKKLYLLFQLSLMFLHIVSAQQATISFESKVDTVSTDSVHVTNLTRGQTVKLNAGESVVFNLVTSAERLLLSGSENGYLYPNPSNEYTTLVFNTTQSEKVFVAIYDMQGKMLLSKIQNLRQGNHRFQLSFPTPGLYHIAVIINKKPLSYKAVCTGNNKQEADIRYLGSESLANDENQKDQLKSAQNGKSLDYSEGDVVHYTVFSGDNITVISDEPNTTKTIAVEFYECKDPDNRNYKIVQIGEQWWMAENLAYLPAVHPSDSGSYTESRYYVYDYEGTDVAAAKQQANYTTYGVLYNWPAALTSCPGGWHLPTDNEWKQLEMALGMSQSEADKTGWRGTNEGIKLKATSGWYNNGSGTDDFGFSALPGGCRYTNGNFDTIRNFGYWWSSTEYGTNYAWNRGLYFNNTAVSRSYLTKGYGFSVRCVRDNVRTED